MVMSAAIVDLVIESLVCHVFLLHTSQQCAPYLSGLKELNLYMLSSPKSDTLLTFFSICNPNYKHAKASASPQI